MEEITSQEEEMKELRQKLYDVEAEINKVIFWAMIQHFCK